MKYLVSLFIVVVAFQCSAQGLNYELGYNNSYHQFSSAIAVNNEHTYVVRKELTGTSFFEPVYLTKYDTTGVVLWEQSISPKLAEIIDVYDAVSTDDGGVLVYGGGRDICDVGGLCFFFVQKYETTGAVTTWLKNDFNCWNTHLGDMSVFEDESILFELDSSGVSRLFYLNNTLNLVDSIYTPKDSLIGVEILSSNNLIGATNDSIFRFDMSGTILDEIELGSAVTDIKLYEDTVYVATVDSIAQFDSAFQFLQSYAPVSYSNYSSLTVDSLDVRALSRDVSSVTLHALQHNLQLSSAMDVPMTEAFSQRIDYSDTHISASQNFNLTLYQTLRLRDYSLNSSSSASVNNGDVSVVDFVPSYIEANLSLPNLIVSGSALIKNEGTSVVSSVRLNHYEGWAFVCGAEVYSEPFSGLNLAPGDSVWIDMGMVHNHFAPLFGDTITYDFCLYSSHVNELTDLNVANDQFCKELLIGYSGLEEFSSNPLPKELIKVVDFLGREVPIESNGPKILWYSDGTSKKVFVD